MPTYQGGGQHSDIANKYGFVVVAVDMLGMAADDVEAIVRAMSGDLGDIITVPDRSHQGILNHLLVVKLMMGDFANDTAVYFNGQSVINPNVVQYAGVSQGRSRRPRAAAVSNAQWWAGGRLMRWRGARGRVAMAQAAFWYGCMSLTKR